MTRREFVAASAVLPGLSAAPGKAHITAGITVDTTAKESCIIAMKYLEKLGLTV